MAIAIDPAERGERARKIFEEGYNCCQAVLLAFADVLEQGGAVSEELLKTLGAGFGGGFGRMREVCGAFSACTMFAIRPRTFSVVPSSASAMTKAPSSAITCASRGARMAFRSVSDQEWIRSSRSCAL